MRNRTKILLGLLVTILFLITIDKNDYFLMVYNAVILLNIYLQPNDYYN